MRIVIAVTVVPVGAAAVILGIANTTYIASDVLFAVVALPAAATSYRLLKSAGLPTRAATFGAVAVTALSYGIVMAIAIEYLVN